MASRDGSAVVLDAAGNSLDDGPGRTFGYDDTNRMVSASVGGSLAATYSYHASGQRVRKLEAQGAQRKTIFHYGLGGELLGETVYSSAGVKELARDYLWLDTLPLAMIETGYDAAGQVTGESIVYLHADHLNTPRLATDATGTVVWRWRSDAFGVGEAETDPDGDLVETVVALRFPGQYYDAETGLHYNYFRDYDSSIGRYVQSDPIGLDGGINTYTYATGNPLANVDPTGQIAAAARAIRPAGAGLGAILACALHPDLCRGVVSAVCEDVSQTVDDFLKPFLNEDKKLTPGEIKKLKDNKIDPEELKGGRGTGKLDLFKDRKGNIIVKPKDGSGPGEPTGININDL